jgi:HD-GYP domain-containing protein (c-di-GMP phosphodiesterase class II)
VKQVDFLHSFTGSPAPATNLPELMCAFSYALDLTEGQPEGHSLRACWIAMRIADAIRIGRDERRIIFFATLLKDLGCSSNSARVAEIYLTDDRSFKHDFKLIGDGIGPALRFVLEKTGRGAGPVARISAIANILKNGPALVDEMIAARCTRGADIARMLRFPEEVALGIHALDEHWDGGGRPAGLSGQAIALPARIALLAQVADVFFCNAGPDAAREEVVRLSGKWLDPELVRAFTAISASPDFWARLAQPDLERMLAEELPDEAQLTVDEDYLDAIALAFGQVIDAKSPYTAGHSERVGTYATELGKRYGIGGADLRSLSRAAALHDVGKLGVSSTILEKPGKLDDEEWQVMRSHAGHTAAILGRIAPLREMAMIAASHHERLDGTGYPLGLDQTMLATEARIISVCDFYDALTADRPYRAAMTAERAFAIMEQEAGGAIDPHCLAMFRDVVAER